MTLLTASQYQMNEMRWMTDRQLEECMEMMEELSSTADGNVTYHPFYTVFAAQAFFYRGSFQYAATWEGATCRVYHPWSRAEPRNCAYCGCTTYSKKGLHHVLPRVDAHASRYSVDANTACYDCYQQFLPLEREFSHGLGEYQQTKRTINALAKAIRDEARV